MDYSTDTEEATSKRLLIVANTPSDNTRALARAVLAGACNDDIESVVVEHREPLGADAADVLAADAVIIGTTENFGYMSGVVKDFLERIYYPCLEQTQGRPWALYVRAGNDGQGALRSVTRIVQGLRWKAVTEPLVLSGEWDDAFVGQARELGLLMSASLDAGIV